MSNPPLLVFSRGAVILLFLTAVSNVASLQLARVTARRHEVAIRAAIGAGTGRLARQLLVENLILGIGGGAAGIGVALALHRAVPRLLPADFPRRDDIAIDGHVLALAVLLSVTAVALIGLLPLLHARRLNVVETLNENSLAPVGGGRLGLELRVRAPSS